MKMKKLVIISISAVMLSATHSANATITASDIINVTAYIEAIAKPNMIHTDNDVGTTYSTDQPPSIEQAKTAKGYLNLAEIIYTPSSTVKGWKRAENITFPSGFYAGVFTRDNKAVIAFRGSELGKADWVTNGILAQDIVPLEYHQAISEALRLKQKYSQYEIHYTGHSLGGGLATAAAISTGDTATVFDASGIADAVLEVIKGNLATHGQANDWINNAKKITNFNLEGEFVSDTDNQQDADTLGPTSRQYGDIYYLSDARFTPLFILDNGLTRHFTRPLLEELDFLSKPFFRNAPNDKTSIDNDINPFTSRFFYFDFTDDTWDIFQWQVNYAINSLPSLLEDLNL